jgi:hypothetical protein
MPLHIFSLPNIILNIEDSLGALSPKDGSHLKSFGLVPFTFFSCHFIELH